jgi:hypothetical protein
VLEPYLGRSRFRNSARRVVHGQHLMQAGADYFYVRQLRDMKGAINPTRLTRSALGEYAALCAWALARAHARSGPAAMVYAYLGAGDAFDRALVRFGAQYADQTERDHALLVKAVKTGRVKPETGIEYSAPPISTNWGSNRPESESAAACFAPSRN